MNPSLLLLPVSSTLLGAMLLPLCIYIYARPDRVRKAVAPLAKHPSLSEQLLPDAEAHVDHFLRSRLPVAMPMIGMLIGEKTIAQLKGIFMEELKTLLPFFLDRSFDRLLSNDNLTGLRKQLTRRAIAPGAAFGAITGLIQCLFCLYFRQF